MQASLHFLARLLMAHPPTRCVAARAHIHSMGATCLDGWPSATSTRRMHKPHRHASRTLAQATSFIATHQTALLLIAVAVITTAVIAAVSTAAAATLWLLWLIVVISIRNTPSPASSILAALMAALVLAVLTAGLSSLSPLAGVPTPRRQIPLGPSISPSH